MTYFAVTLLATAVIYLVVSPPLKSGLQSRSVADLQRVARAWGAPKQWVHVGFAYPPRKTDFDRATRKASEAAKVTVSQVNVLDVVLSHVGTGGPVSKQVTASPGAPATLYIEPFADSVAAKRATSGVVEGAEGALGLVGFVVGHASSTTRVVVFSVPLNGVASAVSLVRSRILLAAAIGLAVALLTGVVVARALTVRVLRLEQGAERVAQGNFQAEFSDRSRDELGRLGKALAHMQSQLEGLDASRRRFLTTASHELRTPIFSLGGFLELLEDEDLDEETRSEFVKQIRQQVERLGKLATQLLDLSRLESAPVEVDLAPTDLSVLARAASAEFLPTLRQHQSELDLRLPQEVVRVMCVPDRVAQLVRILIDNAVRHTPPGTRVALSIIGPSTNCGARVVVHDSGPGIPPDTLDDIFLPFYRDEASPGAGLGLAIAHEVAVQMGAQLTVTSSPHGSTFTLTLPIDSSQTPA